jgi:hypothetical protein
VVWNVCLIVYLISYQLDLHCQDLAGKGGGFVNIWAIFIKACKMS